MSQLQYELARLAQEMSPNLRSSLNFLSKVPKDILERFVPDVECKPSTTRGQRRTLDAGNKYEYMLEVLRALKSDEPAKLLEQSSILTDSRPAQILNVVASVKLADQIDLDAVARNAWNIEYNKKQFAGLVIQVNHPKATGVVYSTGRMMVTGSRSERDSKVATEKCIRVIRDAGCTINAGDSYRVQNICATTQLGYRVRIHEMGSSQNMKDWGRVINFCPEIFSGLVCTLENPKVTVVCFTTGTLLFSGAQHEEDIQIALERFRVLSFRFRY